MFTIRDGRDCFFQWDAKRQVIVSDPTVNEVHFCNRSSDCSLVVLVKNEDGLRVADVPNIILQNDLPVRVYAFCTGYTKVEKIFKVCTRTKPADYVYEETDVVRAAEILIKAEESASKAEKAKNTAENHASSASISANTANVDATAALLYKNASEESATNAATSEGNASRSATAAKQSETNAAQSLSEVTTIRNEVVTKTSDLDSKLETINRNTATVLEKTTTATNASSSASTSASSALDSANKAKVSETNAANSAAEALSNANKSKQHELNAQNAALDSVSAKEDVFEKLVGFDEKVESVETNTLIASAAAENASAIYEYVEDHKLELTDDGNGNVTLDAVEMDNYYDKTEIDTKFNEYSPKSCVFNGQNNALSDEERAAATEIASYFKDNDGSNLNKGFGGYNIYVKMSDILYQVTEVIYSNTTNKMNFYFGIGEYTYMMSITIVFGEHNYASSKKLPVVTKLATKDYVDEAIPNIIYSETEPTNPVEGMIWLSPVEE